MAAVRVTTLTNQETTLPQREYEAFHKAVRGRVILPEHPTYETARRVWNGTVDKRPAMIVRCKDNQDVAACVKLAHDHAIRLSVRGGGHNVAGNAVCDGGLVIDLTEMREVRAEADKNRVYIQGGATLGEVDAATYPDGFTTPTGVVTATGYAGLTLHGGMGWQLRNHGLSSDNVVEAEVVIADGTVVTANDTQHPELLWAIRGGGGNFGVVTSFRSRLHPTPEQVCFSVVLTDVESSGRALRFLRSYMLEAPRELSAICAFWSAPELPQIASERHGQPALFILACYQGHPDKGLELVRPIRQCVPMIADLTSIQSWSEVQRFFDPDYPNGRRYYWKSTYAPALTDGIVTALAEDCLTRPSALNSIDVWFLGGAFSDVRAEDSAFGRRDARILITYEANWEQPEADETNIAWARARLGNIQSMGETRTYLNFAGTGEGGEQLVRDSYGDNYPKLQRIKAQYDPHNLFRSNFNVVPRG